jgi:sigma-B regulation protein RsbU (phosphoserine phosphatase)
MLLPKRRRGKFPLIGINLPAHEISGDFYDYFDLPDGRIAFVIGDISGKGLDAAFLMVRVASLLRWSGKDGLAPAQWLARANNESCQTLNEGPLRLRAGRAIRSQRWQRRVCQRGISAGLAADAKGFESSSPTDRRSASCRISTTGERRLTLGDDALYFFSDGAIDAREAGQERIGNEGLRDMIARHTGIGARTAAARAHRRSEAHAAGRRHDRAAAAGAARRGGADSCSTCRSRRAPRSCGACARVCAKRSMRRASVPELRDRLVLAVDEACTNVIRHAYCGNCDDTITLRLTRERDMLGFELRDEAPAVDPEKITTRDSATAVPGGLGVPFIRALMDDWQLEPGTDGKGNVLRMRKRLHSDGDLETNK